MPPITRRAALLALAPALLSRANPALAAAPAPVTALPGAYALPDGQAKVSARLTIMPSAAGSPPGSRVLDVAMTQLGAARPINRYDVELSKRLHLIAVSGDLRTFLHEHGERPGTNGHFRVAMTFPHGGRWHVYADAVPAGLGQQVMRFEVDLDGAAPTPSNRSAVPQPTGLEGSDGRYGVRFDALDLRAGQEASLSLHLLRDGTPAPDVTPYLGVAAHAVFIAAADLIYVHAHATPAASPVQGGMPGMDHGHGSVAGMGSAAMRPGSKVSPDLALHVRAPKAGTYLLWLQFMAGGQVRTVPFVVAVA